MAAAKFSTDYQKGQCLGDLIQISQYFSLPSCEYTKTDSHKQTTQFLLRNMQFHGAHVIIHFEASTHNFRLAMEVILFFDT